MQLENTTQLTVDGARRNGSFDGTFNNMQASTGIRGSRRGQEVSRATLSWNSTLLNSPMAPSCSGVWSGDETEGGEEARRDGIKESGPQRYVRCGGRGAPNHATCEVRE
jgi:hypothetical protein